MTSSMQGGDSNLGGGPDNINGTVSANQSMQGEINNDDSGVIGSHGEEASASTGDKWYRRW